MTTATEHSVSDLPEWANTNRGQVVPAWQLEAAADRERSIALLKQARHDVQQLRVLVDAYDRRLSVELATFQCELDKRLGFLLLAREDAQS